MDKGMYIKFTFILQVDNYKVIISSVATTVSVRSTSNYSLTLRLGYIPNAKCQNEIGLAADVISKNGSHTTFIVEE